MIADIAKATGLAEHPTIFEQNRRQEDEADARIGEERSRRAGL